MEAEVRLCPTARVVVAEQSMTSRAQTGGGPCLLMQQQRSTTTPNQCHNMWHAPYPAAPQPGPRPCLRTHSGAAPGPSRRPQEVAARHFQAALAAVQPSTPGGRGLSCDLDDMYARFERAGRVDAPVAR